VAHKDQLAGKTLLELGAGTGTLHCSARMTHRHFSGTGHGPPLSLVVTRTRFGQG
jgi:FtsZ-interacting cell division protein ZipA